MKRIIFFCLIIFLIGFIARIASYIGTLHPVFSALQYYQGIGSGSDADYQIKNAIYTINQKGVTETFTHYDYIFLIPLIALFLKTFGYIRGIEILMYFIILLGSLVPVVIFFALAKRTRFIIGSLIAGLILAINPLLISISAGRFVLDTLVQFIFALFIICYTQAIEKKSLLWLVLIGVIGVIQGLNKPFLMVNDLALFLILPFFILIKKVDYKKKFPFIFPKWNISKKMIIYCLIPTIIYLGSNILWEVYEHIAIHRGYFLSDIFLSKQKDSSNNFALRDSLVLAKTPWEKLRNTVMFTLMAEQQLIQYLNLTIIYFSSIIFIYIINKKNGIKLMQLTALAGAILIVIYFLITHLFFYNAPTTSIPQTWDIYTFIGFSIITLLLFFFITKSYLMLTITAVQLPYLVLVGLTLTTGIAPRHYETLIIWFIVCMSLFIDSFIPGMLIKFHPRVYKTLTIIIFLFFLTPIVQIFLTYYSVMAKENKNIQYLSWVKTQIPKDSYILGGTGENLIDIAKYTKYTTIYNTYHTPIVASYTDSVFEAKDIGSLDSHLDTFTTFFPQYAKKGKLFVTDLNKQGWDLLLTSGSKSEIPIAMYSLRVAAKNSITNRILYQLVLK